MVFASRGWACVALTLDVKRLNGWNLHHIRSSSRPVLDSGRLSGGRFASTCHVRLDSKTQERKKFLAASHTTSSIVPTLSE